MSELPKPFCPGHGYFMRATCPACSDIRTDLESQLREGQEREARLAVDISSARLDANLWRARAEIAEGSRSSPPTPDPKPKGGLAAIAGKWPGDETAEELLATLKDTPDPRDGPKMTAAQVERARVFEAVTVPAPPDWEPDVADPRDGQIAALTRAVGALLDQIPVHSPGHGPDCPICFAITAFMDTSQAAASFEDAVIERCAVELERRNCRGYQDACLNVVRSLKRPTPEPKPCTAGHAREVKSIGFLVHPYGTSEQAYTAWARERGINPWCGRPLKECPEPK